MYTKIIGTGSYLPEQVRTNADLEKMVDTSDEWIVTRTGTTHLHADGSYGELLTLPNADRVNPENSIHLTMAGNEVFKVAVTELAHIVDETLAANNLDRSQLDWLVPHQANLRIISATAKKLGMSMDNVVVTLDRHGNTSAASVPCALDEAVRDGRIKPGQLVLLEAFGGGFTWGSALVRF